MNKEHLLYHHQDAFMDALSILYRIAIRKSKRSHHAENMDKFLQLYKPLYDSMSHSRLSLDDFEVIHKNAFAKGAFGKVTIVRYKHNKNAIYAMKTLNKTYLLEQSDRSSPMEERLILSHNEPWLPTLYASFQDKSNLYLIMEYAPGGDLQGLMERRSYMFSEDEARFYCAELILAIEKVHQLGYMHRDIKPGNILIDHRGHIKLGDLGSCIALDTKSPLFMVGTMDYASPEMCSSVGRDPSLGPAYGPSVDWWSVGIILYELLYGERPFKGNKIKIQMSLMNPEIIILTPKIVKHHIR
ncbi:kinase-like domain-containing protein [Pilobolus umbonatus]|nr:kinase-like domain-containing protein [Pilobolus umbonatus]